MFTDKQFVQITFIMDGHQKCEFFAGDHLRSWLKDIIATFVKNFVKVFLKIGLFTPPQQLKELLMRFFQKIYE